MGEIQTYTLWDREGQRKYLNQSERRLFYESTKVLEAQQRCFCHMIYWTGVRISEALNIQVHHIDFSDQIVIIRSLKKRGKLMYRHIPIPPFFVDELKVIVKGMHKGQRIWNYSRRTASRYIKNQMLRSGISGSKSCARGLRHGFAVNCIMNTVPLPLVQRWMGHASIETTLIYTQIMGGDERQFAKRTWEG